MAAGSRLPTQPRAPVALSFRAAAILPRPLLLFPTALLLFSSRAAAAAPSRWLPPRLPAVGRELPSGGRRRAMREFPSVVSERRPVGSVDDAACDAATAGESLEAARELRCVGRRWRACTMSQEEVRCQSSNLYFICTSQPLRSPLAAGRRSHTAAQARRSMVDRAAGIMVGSVHRGPGPTQIRVIRISPFDSKTEISFARPTHPKHFASPRSRRARFPNFPARGSGGRACSAAPRSDARKHLAHGSPHQQSTRIAKSASTRIAPLPARIDGRRGSAAPRSNGRGTDHTDR